MLFGRSAWLQAAGFSLQILGACACGFFAAIPNAGLIVNYFILDKNTLAY
jgi:hypothetical protein